MSAQLALDLPKPVDLTPVHVLAQSGDRHSLCGEKGPLPVVLARFVQAHVEGRGMVVCPACEQAGDLGWKVCPR